MTPRTAVFHDLVSGRMLGLGPMLARAGLGAVSLGYGTGVRLRNRLFDAGWKRRHRAGVPVVSVGNLTLGGTGKTPCVEYLGRFYLERQVRVALLSRGYGGGGGPNDEALLLSENLPGVPHLQGADRVGLAAVAVNELKAELLILDDGFQHRRLARDLDIVLMDATDPFGHGRLFPRGLLREPPSALKRAHAVLLTRCDQVSERQVCDLIERVRQLAPARPIVPTTHAPVGWLQNGRPERPVEAIRGRPVAAFCGIGNPEAFRRTLRNVGVEPIAFRTFGDHHRYTAADLDRLEAWADEQRSEVTMVTTQKDLVKLRRDRIGERDLLALRVGLQIRPGADANEFHRRLERFSPRSMTGG
jgi:tetraacyldisaccharide 4'-kinase